MFVFTEFHPFLGEVLFIIRSKRIQSLDQPLGLS